MRRKLIVFALALVAASASAQLVTNPPPVNAPTNTLAATTSLTVGSATPTAITNIRVYSPTCTPTASSGVIETFLFACTVTGVTTADKIIVNPPAPTSLCPFVSALVTGADTVSLRFSVLTAAACTPSAGTYLIVAIRS